MIQIYIDGKKINAQKGETILQVAKRNEVNIPTLCHHDALEGVGACRLCIVEISHKDWGNWKKLVTSCLYPVEPGLMISTCNEAVKNSRQTTLDLLLARCPSSDVIRKLAEENGEITEYKQSTDGSKCIMCGLCVRACAAVGPCSIGTVNRGVNKEVATPFYEESDTCVGCGSCHAICPTGHIEMIDTSTTRKIWGKTFNFVKCDICKQPVMTQEYKDFAIKNKELSDDYYNTCKTCKQKKLAADFAKVGL